MCDRKGKNMEGKNMTRNMKLHCGLLLAGLIACAPFAMAQYPSASEVGKDGTAVLLEDYVSLPISSPTHGGVPVAPIDNKGQLGRATSMRSEPANAPLAASRMFVDDQSGTLYILDKNKQFTRYINFPELFPKFVSDTGLTVGIVSLAFDPGYAKNGRFYTVHVEKPDMVVSDSAVKLNGYSATAAVNPPAGPVRLESVLVEWTDTNIRNASFEGSARELLRVGFERNHPMADLLFNPLAKPGHADYGNLYVSVGDGAQGETPGPGHFLPQQLNTFMGKVLRITPDVKLHPKDMMSANGQYRIPSTGSDPNPFVSVAGARPEIFAYGFRNPHRMFWDVSSKALIVNDIGLKSWEEVNIVTKGGNYGYAEREGDEQVFVGGANNTKTGSQVSPPIPFPQEDLLKVEGLRDPVVPVYPAAAYSHNEGDSLGSGVVYRGKLMPQLQGKYIFNDMTTGRIFYTDLAEMLATKGSRKQQSKVRELQIVYKSATAPAPAKRRMFDIVAETYKQKGGIAAPDRVLPGAGGATTGWKDEAKTQPKTDPEGVVYGGGRADVRLVIGGDGEIYVLSKADGMIRKMTTVVSGASTSQQKGGN